MCWQEQTKQDGQSSVEFLMTFMFAMGFIFIFFRVALNFGAGYVVHYATFMASRTYLTADRGDNSLQAAYSYAANRAGETFGRFPIEALSITPNGDVNFNSPTNTRFYEFVGAYYSFTSPLSDYKMVGGDINLNFLSESFIGKEPTRVDCFNRVCQMAGASCGSSGELENAIYDNGC